MTAAPQKLTGKLVVLDRDGVINRESHIFIRSPEGGLPVPGALEAIAELTRAGFSVIVATNQSGVGRGLITAAALVRPTGIIDLEASSVQKKMKQKSFAANVNRDDITRGTTDLGVDLTEHIQFVIDAMKRIAGQLGLEGRPEAAPGA